MGVGAYGDEGDEGMSAGADDGEVVRGFVDDEEHGRSGARVGGGEAHEVGSGADVDGTIENAAIEDVDGDDARGGAIGDIEFGGVVGDDGAGRSGAKEHGVGHLVGPGVDGLETVGIGRDDVEFAAIGFEEHLRGSAGEFEVGEKNGAVEIDDGEARLRAAHDEGELAVGGDEDFVGLRDNRDGDEELERARIVDGEHAGAAIDDKNVFGVGREASLDGFGGGVGAAVDLAGCGVDGDELIGAGGGGVDAIAGVRELERIGSGADGDASELVGERVEDEGEAALRGDAPDFVALGVFAESGDGSADGNFGDGLKFGEIEDGERGVGGGDVGVHVEAGAEERRAMLAEKDDDGGDEEQSESEIGAEVFE